MADGVIESMQRSEGPAQQQGVSAAAGGAERGRKMSCQRSQHMLWVCQQVKCQQAMLLRDKWAGQGAVQRKAQLKPRQPAAHRLPRSHWAGLSGVSASSCPTAIMPLRGVRISWLMRARNCDLASVAAAACSSCRGAIGIACVRSQK